MISQYFIRFRAIALMIMFVGFDCESNRRKRLPNYAVWRNSPGDETERSLKELRAIGPLARACIPPELRLARSCICPSPLCRKKASVARGRRLPQY